MTQGYCKEPDHERTGGEVSMSVDEAREFFSRCLEMLDEA